MTNFLRRLSPALLKTVRAIGQEAEAQNLKAYVVGGVVRDLVLNKKNLDLDVVVEGNAIPLAKSLAAKHKTALVAHEKFKTATLVFSDGMRLDLASARKEHYLYPAALPVVELGALQDDLFRRDFTINAMAFSINPQTFGEIVDYYNGLQDLRHKKIKVLHSESFIEDPTRILRAVRFEQRLGFALESETLLWLKSALQKKAEEKVKPERYFQEFRKNLKETQLWKNIQRLDRLKGLKFLGKGVRYDRSTRELMRSVGQQIAWHKKKFKGKDLCASTLGSMALLYGVPQAARKQVIMKFHLSNDEKDNILALDKVKKIIQKISSKNVRPSEVFELLKPLRRETVLFIRLRAKAQVARSRIDQYWTKSERTQLALNGHDLHRLGLKEGAAIGSALKELFIKRIDGKITSRRQELKAAQEMARLR